MSVPQDRAHHIQRKADPLGEAIGPFHAGDVKDGHEYTGMSVVYQHPKTGAQVVGWSGELHGTWGGDRNPALKMLQGAGPHHVGGEAYLPQYAVFHSPHPEVPNAQQGRTLHLRTAQLNRRTR